MKILWALGLLCAATAGAAQAGQIDDLKAGKLQCYAMNAAKHTCLALSGYTFGPTITNQAEVLLSPQPLVTMQTHSTVVLKGEAICGRIEEADIDSAAITVNGQILSEDQAVGVRQNIWKALQPRVGKEICTTYTPTAGGGYATSYTMDGQPDTTTPSVTVTLVDPKDGFTIGPVN